MQYCNPWEFMQNQLIIDPSKLNPRNKYFRSISCSCCFWQGRRPLLFTQSNSPCHTRADLGFVSSGMTNVLNIYKPLIILSHLLSVLECFPFFFSETVQQLLALFLGAMHLEDLDFSSVHKGNFAAFGGALLVDPHSPLCFHQQRCWWRICLLEFGLSFGFVWKDLVMTVKRWGCEWSS